MLVIMQNVDQGAMKASPLWHGTEALLGWSLNTSTTTQYLKHHSIVEDELYPESLVLTATSPT